MTLRRSRGRCRSTFRSVRSPLGKRHQVATILHLSRCRPFVWIDFTLPPGMELRLAIPGTSESCFLGLSMRATRGRATARSPRTPSYPTPREPALAASPVAPQAIPRILIVFGSAVHHNPHNSRAFDVFDLRVPPEGTFSWGSFDSPPGRNPDNSGPVRLCARDSCCGTDDVAP